MMRTNCKKTVLVAFLALAGACSSSNSGGASGSGGHATGGASVSGGSASTGGAVSSGGTTAATGGASGGTGAGGALATGGTTTASGGTSSGGSQSAGGTAGSSSGGASGAGGVAGAGGASAVDAGSGDVADAPADVNLQDLAPVDTATVDGSSSIAWGAFLPLAKGSSTNGEPGVSPDISGHGYNAVYGFGISFSNSSMVISGAGDVTISSQDYIPAVDLTGSYSVSVWVTMNDTSGYRTFVSADGAKVSAFYLQKRGDTNHFAFTVAMSDSNEGAVAKACIATTAIDPAASTAYHLVGTRDATTGVDTLYVDGTEVATATCLSDDGAGWPATTFSIGHGKYDGKTVDYVSGSMSKVGLIGRVLTAAEVAALYDAGPQ